MGGLSGELDSSNCKYSSLFSPIRIEELKKFITECIKYMYKDDEVTVLAEKTISDELYNCFSMTRLLRLNTDIISGYILFDAQK